MTSRISGTKHHETLLCLDGSHDLQWEGQIAKRMNLLIKRCNEGGSSLNMPSAFGSSEL